MVLLNYILHWFRVIWVKILVIKTICSPDNILSFGTKLSTFFTHYFMNTCWFEFYGPVTTIKVMSGWSSNLLRPFLGGLHPQSSWPVLVHILSSVTDNCFSWISGTGTIEMISWSMFMKSVCPSWGSNLQLLNLQPDVLTHTGILWHLKKKWCARWEFPYII